MWERGLPAIAIGIYTFFEVPEKPVAAAKARDCDGFGAPFQRSDPQAVLRPASQPRASAAATESQAPAQRCRYLWLSQASQLSP